MWWVGCRLRIYRDAMLAVILGRCIHGSNKAGEQNWIRYPFISGCWLVTCGSHLFCGGLGSCRLLTTTYDEVLRLYIASIIVPSVYLPVYIPKLALPC
jgi:hypothetical protein